MSGRKILGFAGSLADAEAGAFLLPLDGSAVPDGGGATLAAGRRIVGVFDGPRARLNVAEYPTIAGGYATGRKLRTSRIGLNAWLTAGSAAAVDQARDAVLDRILNAFPGLWLVVERPDGSKRCRLLAVDEAVAGDLVDDDTGDDSGAVRQEFTFRFTALDAYWVGPTEFVTDGAPDSGYARNSSNVGPQVISGFAGEDVYDANAPSWPTFMLRNSSGANTVGEQWAMSGADWYAGRRITLNTQLSNQSSSIDYFLVTDPRGYRTGPTARGHIDAATYARGGTGLAVLNTDGPGLWAVEYDGGVWQTTTQLAGDSWTGWPTMVRPDLELWGQDTGPVGPLFNVRLYPRYLSA